MTHAVPMTLRMPAGVAGAEPVEVDVHAFLVEHAAGFVLVDTGMAAAPTATATSSASWG